MVEFFDKQSPVPICAQNLYIKIQQAVIIIQKGENSIEEV